MNGTTQNNPALLDSFTSGNIPRAEALELLMPERTDTCELLVAFRPEDYSASAIAKAVEDCDVQLLALSVTAMRDRAGRPVAMLTVNSRTPAPVARSLARYGYDVVGRRGEISDSDRIEAENRISELIRILEI